MRMKSMRGVSMIRTSMLVASVCMALVACSCGAASAKDKKVVVGIDLGTTYSCVGVYNNGKVDILANDQGNRITPSYVAFTDEERLIGEAAKNQAVTNPKRTVYDVKRLIGRRFEDPEVQKDRALVSFDLANKGGKPYVSIDNGPGKGTKLYSPEEISAMVLTRMKETAEAYLGHPVQHAVITVPAYFNDAQRQATKDAGTIAGLTVERIINEPTAAAIAYGLDKSDQGEKNVLVFDLGGGTFDVSVLTLSDGVFEVLSTNGDTHLGGEDFDQRVMEYFIKLLKKKHNKDISKDARALQKLRREVERAKRALSSQHQVRVEVESIAEGVDLSEPLTRARFEELNADLFKKTLVPVRKALEDAQLKKGQIDEIVLVGGSTRIPKVQHLLKDFFDGKEPSKGVNPDEAVAYGAAVQGAVLAGVRDSTVGDVLVLDVTPLSLGLETQGGVMTKLIPRNTGVPTKKSQIFSTSQDQQTTVSIQVYQGERAMSRENVKLGQFDLTGIPPAPRGVPQIEVTFEVDADGILQVSALDKGTGKKEQVVIKAEKGRLSQEEIDRMVTEAEEYVEQDKAFKAQVDARNSLESYLYSLKAALREDTTKEKLKSSDIETLEAAITTTSNWLDSSTGSSRDVEEYQEQLKVLQDVAEPIMVRLHQSGGGSGGPGDQDQMHDYSEI